MRAVQRAASARYTGDGMKLHRRTLRLAGRDHTVVGLRPGTRVRFSTNFFHGTWHVLSDARGASVLGRLLWGLSYQSRPGTLVVVDRPFLVPTPFDADPADPIVLVPAWDTPFTGKTARELARRLPLRRPPEGTVRWRTHGLDGALADWRGWFRAQGWRDRRDGRVKRLHGLVALMPRTPLEMREWAVLAGGLDPSGTHGTDYADLGSWEDGYEGEVQVFRDFHRDVSVARRARSDVLARPGAPADPGELRPLIWSRHGVVKRGRAAVSAGRGR
ncbi:hypothetical protein E1293_29025 [Actinomadura darangshiensis]|uniref:Uncharacterized protein n=1 Tax=Actinomadura darangshiensis TaxID=705336 RepID=A0A4R5ASB9_9ACTN|nr:hypothetical protein [Actinomadura darangshiensis]TDD74820.1 hypothetical protein E1293_29025 [Actinomadura darangshiensis]